MTRTKKTFLEKNLCNIRQNVKKQIYTDFLSKEYRVRSRIRTDCAEFRQIIPKSRTDYDLARKVRIRPNPQYCSHTVSPTEEYENDCVTRSIADPDPGSGAF
jgi:hypothetical protein